MQNGVYLPDTIREQIVGYIGWDDSFGELACTIRNPSLCPSTNQKEWWYTGCIRTKILDKSTGEYSEETLVPDGRTIQGRHLSNRKDINQRSLFRTFTYFKSLTRQDPMSFELYRSVKDYIAPMSLHALNIANEEEASRYFSQRVYCVVGQPFLRICIIYYDRDIASVHRVLPTCSITNRLLSHRGAPNYHIEFTCKDFNNAIPLAWKFMYGTLDNNGDKVEIHSFHGIEQSNYAYATLTDRERVIGEEFERYI